MNPQLRRYIADTGPASLTFFASVIGAMLLAKRVEPGLVRVLVCLIPLPSVLWLAWVEISRLRRRDELRQRIEVEAIAIAFAMSFVIVVTLTFLELGNAFSVQASATADIASPSASTPSARARRQGRKVPVGVREKRCDFTVDQNL